jgi:hypothetical protein
MPRQIRSVEERFLAKVDKTSSPYGCWLWLNATQRGGYGCMRVSTHKLDSAPRIAWKLYRGEIPPDTDVLHDCPGGDNKACCNPAHLYLGDQKINAEDAEAKGQFHHPVGVANGKTKMTADQVRLAIKLRQETSMSCRQIAEAIGGNVKGPAVYAIFRGDSWRHITNFQLTTTPSAS